MKLELNTSMVPIFTGTYQDWEPIETEDNGEELKLDYTHDSLMKSIVEAFQYKENSILETLKGYGIDFIDSLKFTGGFYSPREYNFETDSLDFEIETNDNLMASLGSLETKEFKDFLAEKFTSRDGFWSWTPNNYPELMDAIKNKTDKLDQSICAVIQYFISKSEDDREIEREVQEYWQANGDLGLDYKLIKEA